MGGIDNLEENFLVIEESIRGERDLGPWHAFVLTDLSHTSILYCWVGYRVCLMKEYLSINKVIFVKLHRPNQTHGLNSKSF